MNEIVALISNPLVWKLLISYWVFSALVGALPTPANNGSSLYVFVFRFGHILGGNVSRAAQKFNVPGAEPEKGNNP